jgi:hypothetical protein
MVIAAGVRIASRSRKMCRLDHQPTKTSLSFLSATTGGSGRLAMIGRLGHEKLEMQMIRCRRQASFGDDVQRYALISKIINRKERAELTS